MGFGERLSRLKSQVTEPSHEDLDKLIVEGLLNLDDYPGNDETRLVTDLTPKGGARFVTRTSMGKVKKSRLF